MPQPHFSSSPWRIWTSVHVLYSFSIPHLPRNTPNIKMLWVTFSVKYMGRLYVLLLYCCTIPPINHHPLILFLKILAQTSQVPLSSVPFYMNRYHLEKIISYNINLKLLYQNITQNKNYNLIKYIPLKFQVQFGDYNFNPKVLKINLLYQLHFQRKKST